MAGIPLGSGFDRTGAVPLDLYSTVADLTARDAIPSGVRYEGMIVYVEAEETNFQLIGGILDANWEELSGSGGGGGGGGGANWQPVLGRGPVESNEYNEKVWLFAQNGSQSLELWVKIPTSYSPGNPITVKLAFYSPYFLNNWAVVLLSYLIRKNTDAVDSTSNLASVTSADFTNTVAKQMREVSLVVTANGQINSVAINPGDIIRLVLSRNAPSAGTEDTFDLRFIPSSTEVLFA